MLYDVRSWGFQSIGPGGESAKASMCHVAVCLAGSSVMAGTSIALALTLKAKFPGEFCAYCAASIAASLTLYGVTFANMQDSRKNLSFGSVIATTILITGLYATYPDTVTASALLPPLRLPHHVAARSVVCTLLGFLPPSPYCDWDMAATCAR